ncbi:hypothetical protein M153_5920001094 [Pseudoloma neurophilia]|uniref:Uncharacterized protein n=1 Tax=Pseudoloma neurophilia TaxID=146866 RepID=A0A0R0M5R1_9MICR|nr:hypothetical protein M153_5920001094 [Pseudoloma neurophilia]
MNYSTLLKTYFLNTFNISNSPTIKFKKNHNITIVLIQNYDISKH